LLGRHAGAIGRARERMSNRNNFDLIRLTAALQVASTHSLAYFVPESRSWYLVRFIELFPGVPHCDGSNVPCTHTSGWAGRRCLRRVCQTGASLRVQRRK
jgi:peptidoglycan/LPS O-acetylase OafA/YrhL